jgi:hypothetical protein
MSRKEIIMKKIVIADTTLCREKNGFSFKEKIEIARQLEKLNVGIIELPEIENSKTDILLVRTVASFVKSSVLSVAAGLDGESISLAAEALSTASKPSIRIELPVSPVGMEYTCHKKAPKMLEWISFTVKKAKELTVTKVKVKAQKGRKAAVRWRKNKKADGYQIAWSTSKKFTKKTTKIRKIPKEKATKATINCTIKNLKKGKTYYFRIRTYSLVTNKVNGKVATVYGKWSGKKKVKIKK